MDFLLNGLAAKRMLLLCLMVSIFTQGIWAQNSIPGTSPMGGERFFSTAPVIYVDGSAGGANDGTSWLNAYTDLQSALKQAGSTKGPEQIWVANGTYKPTKRSDRNASFIIPDRTAIFGGFLGNEISLKQRDWKTNETILDGNIGARDQLDNSYHVVSAYDIVTGAWIDGFSIRNGYADGSSTARLGAGLLIMPTSRTLTNRVRIANCLFNENSAPKGLGGAVFGSNLFSEILDCTFKGNTAGRDGGAIMLSPGDGTTKISRSYFTENSSTEEDGGAVGAFAKSIEIDNSVFFRNSAQRGGGIYVGEDGTLNMANSTFFSNRTGADAGSSLHNRGSARVINSIFWGDRQFPILNEDQIGVTYSDVEGGFAGTGNIDIDPAFSNLSGGNLSLTAGSPAINAGNAISLSGSFDILRNARIVDAAIDMGAYEFSDGEGECPELEVIFVDITATGLNNGSSWTDAFVDLQDALTLADECGNIAEIWVAQGTYLPSQTLDQSATFALLDNLELYGGFNGTETEREQRDWVLYPTILSGDLDQDGDVFLTEPNAYHILTADEIQRCIVDGFIIRDGYTEANIPGSLLGGAGLVMTGTSTERVVMVVRNSVFINNSSYSGSGGAVFSIYSTTYFENVRFENNYGEESAGAIYVTRSRHTYQRCSFSGNLADDQHGGAISSFYSNLFIHNSLFYGNQANVEAGGLFLLQTNLEATNSTFVSNNAPNRGAISVSFNSGGSIVNSIFWDNGGFLEDENLPPAQAYLYDPTFSLDITYSIMEFGWPGIANLDTDPLFANAPVQDYRLSVGSPGINSGLNSGTVGLQDLAGNVRIEGPTVDRGAFEYSADQTPCPEKGIIFVDITATGMNNGLSWNDAFTDLQYALNLAAVCPVQEIWVAQGTYLPSQSLDQSATFHLLSDLGLYGGFQGIETDRNQRNWLLFPTILSGDLDQDGDVFLTEPNAYHILTAEGIQDCHVDGFIIQDGFVEGNLPSVQESGSGLAVLGTQMDSASVSVQNCLFTNNSSYSSSGGAVFSEFAHVSFTNVEFAGNYGEESAGAVLTRDSYHIFSRCLFRNNLADDASGGAILSIGSILNIDNSLFYSNFANTDGGAISASNDPLRITNSTFANNSAPFSGAIVAGQNASGFIINSIFWDNGGNEDPNLPPAQSYLFDPNFGLTVTYSIMEFGWPGISNLDVDPLFVNPGFGNYRLGNGSPARNSGLNAAVIGTRDLDGNFRIVGSTVDRGAYETQLGFGSSNLITGLILMNALTQEEITEIRNGETIQLPTPLPPINVVAKSEGNDIQSVVFELRGALSLKHAENAKPWALFGDEEGILNPGFLFNGEYKLSVTPYSDENGSGEAGESYDVGFQIVGVAPSFHEEAEKMSAYPNPSSGVFSLKFPESWSSSTTMRITDRMGNVVWTGSVQNPKMETHIQLPQLFDGVYMLQAVSGNHVERLRLVITH
ncbi:MAG: choice-of-anchor Q domain-containing protein [Bacteroidota bacterium]